LNAGRYVNLASDRLCVGLQDSQSLHALARVEGDRALRAWA